MAEQVHKKKTNEAEADGQPGALPTPPWQRTPQRGKARRRDPLTQEAIVKAAIEVLDADGLDGFSMRRVAEALNTGAASLYWHVGSKDGLLDLILEEVIAEQLDAIPDPDPTNWRQQLKEVARTMRRTILGHRDIVQISIGRIPMGPNALRLSERVLAIMRAGGVPDGLAVQSYLLMMSAVNGFTMDEAGFTDEGEGPETPPIDEMAQTVRDYLESLPADQFPNLTEVADAFAMSDQDERFELMLDLFVEGLAKRAQQS
ncbi:MAG TPA: TetR/AcrR family transcriptional regulator [Solirubrobacterales bacterium]|jgi:AcrR family transcriptional regulator|nr:TetR/AcrR family transcriptional regulator [Solirubrobacterales bacterium]